MLKFSSNLKGVVTRRAYLVGAGTRWLKALKNVKWLKALNNVKWLKALNNEQAGGVTATTKYSKTRLSRFKLRQ